MQRHFAILQLLKKILNQLLQYILTFKILHQNKYMIGNMWLLEGIHKFENLQQLCLDLVNHILQKYI